MPVAIAHSFANSKLFSKYFLLVTFKVPMDEIETLLQNMLAIFVLSDLYIFASLKVV